MKDVTAENWLLYLHAFMDQTIAPQTRELMKPLIKKGLTKKPTKIRKLLHRTTTMQTIAEIFSEGGKNSESFEAFLLNRYALETSSISRDQSFDKGFYKLVQESLSIHPNAAKRVPQALFDKIKPSKEFDKAWRKPTQILLAHIWVESLCFRALMHINEQRKNNRKKRRN